MTMATITAVGPAGAAPAFIDGAWTLAAEVRWVVTAPGTVLDEISAALPPAAWERIGSHLVLQFVNSVGQFDVPHLGRLRVQSGKWTETHFEAMLADVCGAVAALPFAAGSGGVHAEARDRGGAPSLPYHQLVYLRHIVSAAAPAERQVVPALRQILRDPHRRFVGVRRSVSIVDAAHVDADTLLDLVSGRATLRRTSADGRLARALRQHLPERLVDRSVHAAVDLLENRFVKAFLGHASAVVEDVREALGTMTPGFARRAIERDCIAVDNALRPIVGHRFWDDVGLLHHVPVESTVLQRKRGYREILGHHVRLRMAPRIPLTDTDVQGMLALKDIARLYELWAFFQVQDAVTAALGHGPMRALEGHLDPDGGLQQNLRRGLELAWPNGTTLCYNPSFSRSRPRGRQSYSLPLRPDIVLEVPVGPAAGLHMFDAKFRVNRLRAEDSLDQEAEPDLHGAFESADLHKMHAYRDAIPGARSVWILYPGSDRRWYPIGQGTSATDVDGVGALPLNPTGERVELHNEIATRIMATY